MQLQQSYDEHCMFNVPSTKQCEMRLSEYIVHRGVFPVPHIVWTYILPSILMFQVLQAQDPHPGATNTPGHRDFFLMLSSPKKQIMSLLFHHALFAPGLPYSFLHKIVFFTGLFCLPAVCSRIRPFSSL
jgi:hypothetical protein